MSALYSLRPELEFSAQTQHGKSYVVVKDPVTVRYFRFTETQAVILDLVRAPMDIDQLAAAASDRLGANVGRASLEGLLASLDEKLLLDTPATQEKLGEYRERKTRKRDGNLLYLRLVSLNAEAVFEWLFPKVRWCFTPAFHVFAVLMILSGVVITSQYGPRMTAQFLTLLSLHGILIVWVTVYFVVVMHEFAHGLTCRYFGGKVRELGFILIYFMPALYCDVSDAWMFPSRRQRIWVTFAGGYFQLVVWGFAAVVWRLVAEDTLISSIALSAILFGGIQTLVNFNPLIKLDGYYMLSDYLEIPNLQDKAFRAAQSWISGNPDPVLESDQRRPLLIYGGLSLTFSTLLLVFAYVNIFLLTTSLFAFSGLVGFLLFAGFTLKHTAEEPVAGAKALLTRARRKKYRNLGIAVAFLLVICFFPFWLIPGAPLFLRELRIASEFTILPLQESVVRSETSGTIAEIMVREGSRVEQGQVVAQLYDFDKERDLSLVTGELEQKRAELSLLRAGPRAEERTQAQRLVETKQTELGNVRRNIQQRNQLEQTLERNRAELALAGIELQKASELFAEGLGPRFDMELAETARQVREQSIKETEAAMEILAESNDREEDLKERELAQAQSALTLLNAGFRTEEIQQREAEVETLEDQQRILENEQKKREIRAPISGTVVTRFVEQLKNRHLNPGDELLRIVDIDRVTAEMRVPEKEMVEVLETFQEIERLETELNDLDPDDEDRDRLKEELAELRPVVQLRVRSYPAREFEGRVDFIAPVAQTEDFRPLGRNSDMIPLDTDRYVFVRTELGNEDGALKPTMTGVAKIHAGRRLVIQKMTRRIIRTFRTEFWHLLP